MEDFVGTSIQYSEQQIKLLEKQHAFEMETRVSQLIESGFLDSDYEGSSGEFSDYESDTDDTDDIDAKNDTNINSILLSNNSVSDNSVESIENVMKMNDDNIKDGEGEDDQFAFAVFGNFD
eukprot:UN02308